MLFNSLEFLIFFPVVATLHFLLPHRFRWMLLLAASYYFYASWNAKYLTIILALTLLDYVAAICIEKTVSAEKRRVILLVSVAANLGLLFVFKYFNFFCGSLDFLLARLGTGLETQKLALLLPLGISFHTFQSLSYTIEVYRGTVRAERRLGHYALFVAFFPQLVAGPIERATRLLPQFDVPKRWDYDRIENGLTLMLWGFFKKVVVADRLAILVDHAFRDVTAHSGAHLLVATYGFAVQLYCDFSGYTDIARGCARILGFELTPNFQRPYFAQSIAEFWRRWHMSLMEWFRDFVYIPLGGNRGTATKTYRNVLVVFLISGLWHGADWKFVVWGGLHGIYIVSSLLTRNARGWVYDRLGLKRWEWVFPSLRMLFVFHLALVAWVFFRANSTADALFVIRHVATAFGGLDPATLGVNVKDLWVTAAAVGAVFCVEDFQENRLSKVGALDFPALARTGALYAMGLLILVFGRFSLQSFVYFQF